MSTVKLERQGRVAVLRLDKDRGNAIDAHLLEDLAAVPPQEPQLNVVDLLAARGVRPATFADWQAIDAAEQARGVARAPLESRHGDGRRDG